MLVFDSGLLFIKGKTYPQTAHVDANNIDEFSNGDYLISETLGDYSTAVSTLVRTLPDLSKPSCNSFDFIPDIKTDILIVTDISDRLAYGSNFAQTDSTLNISVQNLGLVSQTDCSYNTDVTCDTSLCNIYRLSGPEKNCHLSDTLKIILNRSVNCNLVPAWTVSGTAVYKIVSQTDSLIKIRATSNGKILVKAVSISDCRISQDSIAIDVNISLPKIDLGQDIMLCSASTIKLNAGSGFKSYQWQDGSVDSTFTAYLPGTYYVTATDYCENDYKDSININLAPAVPFDLGPDKEICANDTISISAPAGFSNYYWSPDYLINTPYGQTIKLSPDVDTIYTVTAIKAIGCSVLDSIRIRVHPVKKINLGNDTSLCQGASIDLNAGANFISYQWNTGSTNQSVIAYSAGMYSVAAMDDNGCKSKDSLSILNVFTNPVNLGNDKNLCQNDSMVLNAGNGFQNYSWQDNSVNQTFIVHTTGQFWVKVKDDNHCIFSDTINIINIVPDPTINLGADTSFCDGQSLLLSPGNDFIKYTWQDNSHNQSFTASQQGQYSVMVTDPDNCSAKDTLLILIVYPKPIVSIGNDTVLCKGQSFLLDAGNGFARYLWQDNSDGRFFNASATGYYRVKVTDNRGCFNIDTLRIINVITSPENFVSSNYNICEDRKEYIRPIGQFSSYLWSNGTTSDSVLILTPGNYWLSVKDAYGCEAKESFEVVKKNCIDAVYFPNAFTPNNDNRNEVFKPTVSGNIEQYHIEIYNRYGTKVFESNDIAKGWNGDSYNFHEITGVYVWICTFKFKDQLREIRKGSLILIR